MREIDRWPLGLLAREAARNVLGIGARLMPLVLAAVLLGSAQVAVAVHTSAAFDASLTELESQGRHILDISPRPEDVAGATAVNPAGVSRASCEALTSLPGVKKSGIVIEAKTPISIPQLGARVPVRRTSETLIPLLRQYDVVIGTSLGTSIGLAEGATVRLIGPAGTPLDAVVAGGPELPSSLALFGAPAPGDDLGGACRVQLTRAADEVRMIPALLGSLEARGATLRATPVLGDAVDVVAMHLNRTERFLPLMLGIIGGVITAVLAFMRSAELATYRLAGTSRRSLGILLTLESAILAGVFLAASALAQVVLGSSLVAPGATGLWSLVGAFAWVATGALLAAPLLRRRPSDMAKDR